MNTPASAPSAISGDSAAEQRNRTVIETLAEGLSRHGVEVFFGLPGGGGCDQFINELVEAQGIRYVSARHEQAAISMADGYSRSSGKVGVAVVSRGPGITNTSSPLRAATLAGSRLLVIVSDNAPHERWNVMRIPQQAFLSSIVGHDHLRILGAGSATQELEYAFRDLDLGLGPVVCNVPDDVFNGRDLQEGVPPRKVDADRVRLSYRPSEDDLDAAAGLIAISSRPVVLAGKGAKAAGARDLLVELAERTGSLLATSVPANGIFDGDPYCVGISGSLQSSAEIREILGEADLLMAFGSTLDHFQISHGELYMNARVIHVDHEPQRVGERSDVHVGLVGDCKTVAEALLEQISELTPEVLATTRSVAAGWRTDAMRERLQNIDKWADVSFDEEDAYANQYGVVRACDELLPANRQIVIDCGQHMAPAAAFVSVGREGNIVTPWEFGLVGNGLGSAIGAAIGRPDLFTVAFLGDGGLMMALPDLDTPVRHKVPILIVLADDGSLSAERRLAKVRGEIPELADYGSPDYGALAEAMGYDAYTARSAEEVRSALAAISTDRQSLLRVVLDKDRDVAEYIRSMQGWGW